MGLEEHKGLRTLESFNPDKFAEWFQNGFRDIKTKERRFHAFHPFHYFIGSGREGDITGDLKKIYDALKDSSKTNFHEGIRNAFSQLSGQPDGIDLGTELLHLTARIESPEGLPEIIRQVEERTFESFGQEKQREIFGFILNVTCGMSRYQETRYNKIPGLIRNLKDNPHFDSNYSPMTFIALCSAEPDTFYEHLALLREDFAKLHKDKGTKDIYITGHQFIYYVGLERLFSSYEELSFCPPDSDRTLDYDNWLIHAVFAVKEITTDKKGDTLKFSYLRDGLKKIEGKLKPWTYKQEYTVTGERVTQLDNILNKGL